MRKNVCRRCGCLLATVVLCAMAASVGHAADQAENRVPNSGFEKSLNGWKLYPKGRTKTRFELDTEVHKEGVSSACLMALDATDRATLYTNVQMQAGRNYVVSFWYRLKDFEVSSGGAAVVNFSFNKKDGGNGSAGSAKFSFPVSGTNEEWRQFRREFRTPEGTVVAQFSVISMRGATGTAWLDAVSITEVPDKAVIRKITKAPAIDGRLDDACWRNAEPLSNFYTVDRGARPALTPTTAWMAYDNENLYIAFRNTEPHMDALKCDAKARDGAAYNDDCDEIYIAASRGRMFQFIVNCGNAQWDGKLSQRMPGDPYRADKSWNGKWKSATGKGKGEWITEVSIPLRFFGGTPKAGEMWRINLARERHGYARENTHWNRMEGKFSAVPKFATLTFARESAQLKRFSEEISGSPFLIERKSPKFAELLGEEPGNYIVGDWGHGYTLGGYPKPHQEKYTPESFRREQDNFLTEHGKAGMYGPRFPWVETHVGMERIRALHEQYGMKFPFALMNSSHWRKAIEQGAIFMAAPAPKRSVNSVDLALRNVITDYIVSYFQSHQHILPYVNIIHGVDEPMNTFANSYSRTCNVDLKDELDAVDAEIRKDYGFGKYGLHDSFGKKSDVTADALSRIATLRWWNAKFAEVVAEEQVLLKKHAPGIPYVAANTNCCSGLSRLDVARYSAHTDWVACDAYPTSSFAHYGRERALYHTGFSVKVIHDVSGGKPTICMPQAFIYHGRAPSPLDMREWASQALKNGATNLDWFAPGPFRFTTPDSYKEMIRLGHIVGRMKRLILPEETQTAILLSNHSRWGTKDNPCHGAYTLYTILGEQLGAWFRFTNETTLAERHDSLGRYRLLYVPQLKYCDSATVERIVAFANRGGTLVVFDPEALQWNLDGAPHTEARATLMGGSLGARRNADYIVISGKGYGGIAADTKLPLNDIRHRESEGRVMAYDITHPEDAEIFARYKDGKPAAYSRKVGKGKVIYFAVQPFGNSSLAVKPGAWAQFFKALAGEIGEPTSLPVWNFLLPEKGAEIPINYIVKP